MLRFNILIVIREGVLRFARLILLLFCVWIFVHFLLLLSFFLCTGLSMLSLSLFLFFFQVLFFVWNFYFTFFYFKFLSVLYSLHHLRFVKGVLSISMSQPSLTASLYGLLDDNILSTVSSPDVARFSPLLAFKVGVLLV